MTDIIKINNVSKSYGGVKANVDISMTVKQGSITGIIGPNGCGKTTLFNSIVGYHPIDNGSIEFDGRKSQASGRRYRSAWPAEDVPAGPDLFENGLCGQYANLCLASQRFTRQHLCQPSRRNQRTCRTSAGICRSVFETESDIWRFVIRTAEAA